MKVRKILSTILVLFILAYLVLSLVPVGIGRSYAADKQAGTLSPDINGIDETLYPGFKGLINNLTSQHPNYKFLVYYTGMDWAEVLTAEYQGHSVDYSASPLNLFQVGTKYNGMWTCPICGNKPYDNGSWCCASKEAIAYMMDPRNSLNETDLFQFKDLEGSDVTYEDIARVVANYGSYINNQETIQAIVDASKQYNVNGYFLVAKIINEHGKNGSTLSNGNGYNGKYVGVYNFFNIGSYGKGSDTIINNGLSYAQNSGWTSRRAAIFGGTEIVKESYITRYSQNTLYYQKFNVSGKSALGSHQYQQNIMAAQSQGTDLKKYYNGNTSLTYTFIIPLYKNMPKTASIRPDTTKVNSITYENGRIKNVSSTLTVRATPSKNGLAIGKLNGEETIKILKRASGPSSDGYNWDLIVSNKLGTYGYAARYVGGDECIVSDKTTGTSSGTANPPTTPEVKPPEETEPVLPEIPEEPEEDKTLTLEEIEERVEIVEEKLNIVPEIDCENIKIKYEEAIIKNLNGEEVSSGKIGTGYIITIEEKDYTIVKKGDTNGDGNTNISDAISILNHLKGKNLIDGVKLEAAKVKGQTDLTISDVIQLLNFLKGKAKIELYK